MSGSISSAITCAAVAAIYLMLKGVCMENVQLKGGFYIPANLIKPFITMILAIYNGVASAIAEFIQVGDIGEHLTFPVAVAFGLSLFRQWLPPCTASSTFPL
eukprot:CAMPEP_0170191398 /NCGR_PEP_ID=MMETSP0040_2-20121228/51617_1 /TAXON_ID=641309 /ORGANISM="Lotharella oceanica, Strain CCMP622" /LENGTH=101 /DNA_ID=CAMNT_0010439471 /DNA_START=77 /DNA_END=382 /DNA_ORIENTATION=-